jgi:hypothetical protein
MSNCRSFVRFNKYFKENMQALGMPVPTGLFGTFSTAIATATTMLSAIKTLGAGATVAELIGATVGLEKLAVASSLLASVYVGAVIGSIAVATGHSISCRIGISDTFATFIRRNKLEFEGWQNFYFKNPEILDSGIPSRRKYYSKALA